jgi:uncharacterized protein YcaQ
MIKSDAGAWCYAFIYDLTRHHSPDITEQARYISEKTARQKLAELYFNSVGAARLIDVMKLFGWKKEIAEQVIQSLVEKGLLLSEL